MGLGTCLSIVGHTTHHHHCRALVATNLDLGECFLVRAGSLSLQRPRSPALALVAEPQLVRGGLLKNSHKRFLIRLRLGLQDTLDVLIPLLLSSIIEALDVVPDVSDGPSLLVRL